jgi:hypothetical protein
VTFNFLATHLHATLCGLLGDAGRLASRLVDGSLMRGTLGSPGWLLTDKTCIHLRSTSVRTYTFFTTGFPRFLSIHGARGLLALNQVLI